LWPTDSQLVRLGIGPPFGSHDQIYLSLFFFFQLTITFILFPMASSLTRKRVCSLECLLSLVRTLTTSNHTLPYHPRLCSLSVASYDSQGLRWKYSNPPPHGEPTEDSQPGCNSSCSGCEKHPAKPVSQILNRSIQAVT
jgi:hypothetical protein